MMDGMLQKMLEAISSEIEDMQEYQAFMRLTSHLERVNPALVEAEDSVWQAEMTGDLSLVLAFLACEGSISENAVYLLVPMHQAIFARGYLLGKASTLEFVVREDG